MDEVPLNPGASTSAAALSKLFFVVCYSLVIVNHVLFAQIGHTALKHLVYIEDVHKELKRRRLQAQKSSKKECESYISIICSSYG